MSDLLTSEYISTEGIHRLTHSLRASQIIPTTTALSRAALTDLHSLSLERSSGLGTVREAGECAGRQIEVRLGLGLHLWSLVLCTARSDLGLVWPGVALGASTKARWRRAGAEDLTAGALRDARSYNPCRRHLTVAGVDGAAARVRDCVGLPVFVVGHA